MLIWTNNPFFFIRSTIYRITFTANNTNIDCVLEKHSSSGNFTSNTNITKHSFDARNKEIVKIAQ